jgi:superfamily II DNA/RNA helicase
MQAALEHPDASGLSLKRKIASFAAFMAERCTPEEREEFLDALAGIGTGVRRGGARQEAEWARLQPNVRVANGETDADERRRLMLAFNAPFFPEILVASSVLAEGVDLQLDCRHVIHHDLCWNPSTLEQRTGRVDRIGAKAEQVGKPICVYLPYVTGTQDEKMYRVVRDRERWFQVVMGEEYSVDEATADKLATRVPLPESAARGLAMRLEV